MGPELLHMVVLCLVYRWNVKAGINNKGDNDFGHYSPWHLRLIRALAEKLGIGATVPDFHLPPDGYNPEELFGAKWIPARMQQEMAKDDGLNDMDVSCLLDLLNNEDVNQECNDLIARVLHTAGTMDNMMDISPGALSGNAPG